MGQKPLTKKLQKTDQKSTLKNCLQNKGAMIYKVKILEQYYLLLLYTKTTS